MTPEPSSAPPAGAAARVLVDRTACVGSGQCVLAAESVFDQSTEDGLVVVLTPAPGPGELDDVRDAVDRCPARAIGLSGDRGPALGDGPPA
ncbi:ferredoxin [Streptomyces lonarensis]|uniref:Ferredoxin n=1 Tax=Streptomyces lonarensis TaxID=700599 RepID=A0A7X6HYF7_9ACTN|nr:ferredoxin [Streptomyces lonarensis]NJQ05533.1 ferredoxin [Streptomyces lonarensis]